MILRVFWYNCALYIITIPKKDAYFLANRLVKCSSTSLSIFYISHCFQFVLWFFVVALSVFAKGFLRLRNSRLKAFSLV